MKTASVTLALVAALAGPASAQPSSPPSKPPSIGLRGYAALDANMMAATKSFEAAFGTAQMTAFGGGAEIDVWKQLFVRIAGTRARKTGTRVFVDSGEVFDLGI